MLTVNEPAEEPFIKCQRGKPCKFLKERLGSSHAKGLSILQLCNMKTGHLRYAGVVYKTSSKDRGLLLNVCPWCKEDINWVEEEAPQVEEATPGAGHTCVDQQKASS